MDNPVVGYEKVKVTEIPLSAFDTSYDYDDEGGVSTRASALTMDFRKNWVNGRFVKIV
jgi:hypothetical protein